MRRLLQWFSPGNLRIGVIALPWLVSAAYLWIFAADRYVAESVVALRQSGSEMPSQVDALSALFGSSTGSREDQLMLEAHILSVDMLQQLEERFDLRRHFSEPSRDVMFRLRPNASREQFLRYYRSRVDVDVDDRSGLLTIKTQGFSPEVAQRVNQEIVAISEQFINESSHRLAREQMAFAEAEMHNAREAVNLARAAVLAFQNEHGVIDPVAQISANTGLTVELQAMLARYEAELKGLLAFLNDDAPQVQSLRAQIAGVEAQLQAESRRAMHSAGNAALNVLAGDYQELLAELEFAQDAYRMALVGVETARVESTRKLKSLVLVESPALPESPGQPRRGYILFALLLGLTLLYGILRLIVATIEDHQE